MFQKILVGIDTILKRFSILAHLDVQFLQKNIFSQRNTKSFEIILVCTKRKPNFLETDDGKNW